MAANAAPPLLILLLSILSSWTVECFLVVDRATSPIFASSGCRPRAAAAASSTSAAAPALARTRLSSTSLNDDASQPQPLSPDQSGRIAVVTGATRGIGKGIALELGLSGMTVYCAGRSSRTAGITSERDLGEDHVDCTVERTAEEIDAMPGSGVGIPVICDVSNDDDVRRLIDRVRTESGRLDVLVCSAFQTPPDMNEASFRDDFWKQGAPMWDVCHGVGLRGTYVACCEAAPLMIETASFAMGQGSNNRPLMVLISSFGGKSYTFNVAYGVGKAGTDRLASDMALQLSKHSVDTVSLYPGIVRTEGNLEMERRGEWAEASGGLDLASGESPRFTGRAVVKLASDPSAMEKRSGKVVVVAELATELGFFDDDGRQPPSIRSLKFILPSFVFPKIEAESGKPLPSWMTDNVPDYLLPWSVFLSGPPPES